MGTLYLFNEYLYGVLLDISYLLAFENFTETI